MVREEEARIEGADEEFRTSVLVNNPDLYRHLFPEEPKEEFEIIEMAPQSEAEMQALISEMRREGVLN